MVNYENHMTSSYFLLFRSMHVINDFIDQMQILSRFLAVLRLIQSFRQDLLKKFIRASIHDYYNLLYYCHSLK